jgi:hypothetical protein
MSRSGARLLQLAPIFASAFGSARRDPAARDSLAGPIRIGVRGPAALSRRDERFAGFLICAAASLRRLCPGRGDVYRGSEVSVRFAQQCCLWCEEASA